MNNRIAHSRTVPATRAASARIEAGPALADLVALSVWAQNAARKGAQIDALLSDSFDVTRSLIEAKRAGNAGIVDALIFRSYAISRELDALGVNVD